jgi:hypothetical protein
MLGLLGGYRGPTRLLGLTLGFLASFGWLALRYRERWVPAAAQSLGGTRVLRATYTARDGFLNVRNQNGRSRRIGWRDPDAMTAALHAAGVEAEVERFELGAVSVLRMAFAILALGGVALVAIGVLSSHLPALAGWPCQPLLLLGAIPPVMAAVWSATSVAELARETVRLRVGWRTRVVPRAEIQEIAVTEDAVVVRVRGGATMRVPGTSQDAARRFVRAFAGAN